MSVQLSSRRASLTTFDVSPLTMKAGISLSKCSRMALTASTPVDPSSRWKSDISKAGATYTPDGMSACESGSQVNALLRLSGTTIDGYFLDQNYPNPFNPTTRIRFHLPSEGFVKLRVYNVAGQEMATLVYRHLNKGWHAYEWDGNNAASGIYIARLTAGASTTTQQMVLQK